MPPAASAFEAGSSDRSASSIILSKNIAPPPTQFDLLAGQRLNSDKNQNNVTWFTETKLPLNVLKLSNVVSVLFDMTKNTAQKLEGNILRGELCCRDGKIAPYSFGTIMIIKSLPPAIISYSIENCYVP